MHRAAGEGVGSACGRECLADQRRSEERAFSMRGGSRFLPIMLVLTAVGGGAVVLSFTHAGWVDRDPAHLQASHPATSRLSGSTSRGGEGTEARLDPDRGDLRRSVGQWPASPAERMRAMSSRLARVADALNAVAGRHYVVMLGQTDRVAESQGNGIIVVDTAMMWRLSEDALACLLAHEFAHELLGHREQFERLRRQPNESGYAQQLQNIELAADTLGGRLLARTSYSPEGYAELLRQVRSARWESVLTRQYYPHPRRIAAFRSGFDLERRSGKGVGSASRPAGADEPRGVPE